MARRNSRGGSEAGVGMGSRKDQVLADEEATLALGAALARGSSGGLVVFLRGELGTGKTTFARGFLRALGHQGWVKSPTYTLVEPYEIGGRRVYHFDCYRLSGAEELELVGARDYFTADALCLIEWPERAEGGLPQADLDIVFRYGDGGRLVTITAHTARGDAILARWP